jgi:hypothetical protein
VELAHCCTGFERKAVFSETLREISSSEVTLKKITRADALSYPTSRKDREKWGTQFLTPPRFSPLFADAEFPNDSFIALGIVSLKVVEQATPLADQHEQAAARAVVLLVRLEVVRQLANAFTDDGDLNLGTPRVSRVRLIPVNDGFLLLSG